VLTRNIITGTFLFSVPTRNKVVLTRNIITGTFLFSVPTRNKVVLTRNKIMGTFLFSVPTRNEMVVYNKLCKFDRRQKGAYTPVFRKIYK